MSVVQCNLVLFVTVQHNRVQYMIYSAIHAVLPGQHLVSCICCTDTPTIGTLEIQQCALYTVQHSIYSIKCTVYNFQLTIYSAPYSVEGTDHTIQGTLGNYLLYPRAVGGFWPQWQTARTVVCSQVCAVCSVQGSRMCAVCWGFEGVQCYPCTIQPDILNVINVTPILFQFQTFYPKKCLNYGQTDMQ